MKQDVDIPIVLNIVKSIGDQFLKDLEKQAFPTDKNKLFYLLNEIEKRRMSFLKEKVYQHYPKISWADDDLYGERQKKNMHIGFIIGWKRFCSIVNMY